MEQITEWTKSSAKTVHEEALASLRPFAEARGLDVVPRGARFDPVTGEMTVRVVLRLRRTADGRTTEQVCWERYAESFGLPKDGLGQTFESRGEKWTVVGLQPNRRRFPVVATNAAGRRTLWVARDVENLLRAGRAAK